MAQTPGLTAHRIWQWYERGVERHRMAGLYEKTEQAHRFFAGDQWAGVESGGELLPKYNFIQSIVEYKVAGVASNTLTITYTPLESGGPQQPQAALLCQKLTAYAGRQWERLKMDKLCWNVVKDACIAGDSYLYFYDGDCRAQPVDTCNVHLADEQVPDLQQQEYILIAGRQTVGALRREARNGSGKRTVKQKKGPRNAPPCCCFGGTKTARSVAPAAHGT